MKLSQAGSGLTPVRQQLAALFLDKWYDHTACLVANPGHAKVSNYQITHIVSLHDVSVYSVMDKYISPYAALSLDCEGSCGRDFVL